MSLTNPNKVVTEERLSEFYGEILPYLGGMPELLGNKIARGDLYSTTEKIIGQWIDSKPIYQKTVNLGTLPNSQSETPVAAGISNLDKVISLSGYGYISSTGMQIPLPYTFPEYTGQDSWQVGLYYKNGYIYISVAQDMSAVNSAYATIRYTKTTDSAQAVGVDTDYSTTEKIVGTWIDGKPIYQKTIDCGTLTNATTKDFTHNIASIGQVLSVEGFATDTSGTCVPANVSGLTAKTDYQLRVVADRTKISLIPTGDYSTLTAYITLRYTKTV